MIKKTSLADPVSHGSRILLFSIPDPICLNPGTLIRIKEFKYFNPKTTTKNCLYSIENIIRVVDPRSRIRLQILAIPDPNKTAVPFILFKKNKFWPVSGQDCNP